MGGHLVKRCIVDWLGALGFGAVCVAAMALPSALF
jgi:hypothetical protein